MIPVILLGGILTGAFTPTEAGVVAVIWIIAVVIPALNRGHFKNIPYDFCLAGLIFSLPLITIGAANAFGWMLAYLRGASVIADWIISLAGNDAHLMMLLLVLLFTVVGDFIEPVPTIIIFMPLVNTLTQAGDINAVHMGVVLIATLAFGLITPPYGLVLLMASKFVGVPFSKALRAALPIYVVFLVTITFTIYFPKVVLWLPKQVIPESVGCFKSPQGRGLSARIDRRPANAGTISRCAAIEGSKYLRKQLPRGYGGLRFAEAVGDVGGTLTSPCW
jgi:TRAP-type C4-dicarboxylate transport system permease large subunit